jgi:hypothetical protein
MKCRDCGRETTEYDAQDRHCKDGEGCLAIQRHNLAAQVRQRDETIRRLKELIYQAYLEGDAASRPWSQSDSRKALDELMKERP